MTAYVGKYVQKHTHVHEPPPPPHIHILCDTSAEDKAFVDRKGNSGSWEERKRTVIWIMNIFYTYIK